MLVVGLTGGIGSGKSTVVRLFEELHTPVYDADVIARDLVRPGQPALAELVKHFGSTLLNADGSLERAKLRTLVFNDVQQRQRLESILHPLIRARMQADIEHCPTPYCIACIPLLLEARQQDLVQRILVVDIPEELQIERVQRRDGLERAMIQRMMAAQATRAERLQAADEVIDNARDLAQLRTRVMELHRLYLDLSTSKT